MALKQNNMNKLEEKVYDIIVDMNRKDISMGDGTKQLIELTEQECIGFAEFFANLSEIDSQVWENEAPIRNLTIKEIFQLYLKSKENE